MRVLQMNFAQEARAVTFDHGLLNRIRRRKRYSESSHSPPPTSSGTDSFSNS